LQTYNIFAVIENNDCTENCVKFSNITSLLHSLKDVHISNTATQPTELRDKGFRKTLTRKPATS